MCLPDGEFQGPRVVGGLVRREDSLEIRMAKLR